MKAIVSLVSLCAVIRISAADLTVYAAASLSEALTEIGAAYEKQCGDKLQFNFGASNTLARQIQQGAPADVFISADEAKMDALEKQGLLRVGTRRAPLSNTLVLVVATNASAVPKAVADLAQPVFTKIAIGEPESVPAGIYAHKYLENARLWEALQEKLVPTESVRAALAAVEAGNADVGFVYKTDSLISKKVKIAFEIPASEGPKISYPIGVLQSSKQPERAQKLAEYLAAPSAGKTFEKFGFIVGQ